MSLTTKSESVPVVETLSEAVNGPTSVRSSASTCLEHRTRMLINDGMRIERVVTPCTSQHREHSCSFPFHLNFCTHVYMHVELRSPSAFISVLV